MAFSYFGFVSSPASDNGTSSGAAAITLTPPASMTAGQLVIVTGQARSASASVYNTIANAGGQSWTTGSILDATNSINLVVHWCIFNGTWSANPSFGGVGSAVAFTVTMEVFGAAGTIELDVATDFAANVADATNVCTIPASEISTSVANCLLYAVWCVSVIHTWSTLTGGWTYANNGARAQTRNTTGSDNSTSSAWLIQAGSGNSAAVSNTHAAGGQNFTRSITAFRELAVAASFPPLPNMMKRRELNNLVAFDSSG